jgi:hypothetical protein
MDDQPDYRLDDQTFLGDQIVEFSVSLLPSEGSYLREDDASVRRLSETFYRMLDLDGFAISDGVLCRAVPSEFDLPQAEDDIERLLNKHAFSTPKGHLDQALNAHTRGEWASANAQLRSFFEGLLDEMAIGLDATAASLSSRVWTQNLTQHSAATIDTVARKFRASLS